MITWPSVFYDPDAAAPASREVAISLQLIGWANCRIERPPESFGVGMLKLSRISGCGTPEEVEKAADEILTSPGNGGKNE